MLKKDVHAADGGFVPARLKMARKALGLKQNELADLISRTPATISKWENDGYVHAPDAQDIHELSKALKVLPQWFYKNINTNTNAAFFRSLRTELKSLRDKSEARLAFVYEIFQSLESRIEFPEIDIPDLMEDRDYRSINIEFIENISIKARDYWGLGDDPIDDLMLIIENSGIVVAEDFMVSSKLDGVSRWFGETPVMLLAKDKETAVRRRFDAAHELGHIILHRNLSVEQLKIDWRLIEEQAMAFASAFLLPESSFAQAVSDVTLDNLADAKPTWKVSIGAMIMRLKMMNIIGHNESSNLWKYYSYRQWRGHEPFDRELEVEIPLNLSSAIRMILEDGKEPTADLISEIGLSEECVASLLGVPELLETFKDEIRPKLRLVRHNISKRPILAAND
jgi:Zn-dependent peptidase ImmA (M78 family)/transcriptional regulator with XRE-family HTH domain